MAQIMTKADLQFKIDQLRKDKMILCLESIKVTFIMVVSAAFLPQMLYQFVFASKPGFDTNMLNFIAPVAYLIALVFFLFSAVGNMKRWNMVKALEKELSMAKK